MIFKLMDGAKEDIAYWKKKDRATLEKIRKLTLNIGQTPFTGLGKPEPLRHELAGGAGASVVNTGWCIASSAIVAMSCARSRRRVGITKENLSFHQTAHMTTLRYFHSPHRLQS